MYIYYFPFESLSMIKHKDDSFILMILFFTSIPLKTYFILLRTLTHYIIHIIKVQVFSSHET